MGSGGLGAVVFAIDVRLLLIPIALLLLFAIWKIAKLIWAAVSG